VPGRTLLFGVIDLPKEYRGGYRGFLSSDAGFVPSLSVLQAQETLQK